MTWIPTGNTNQGIGMAWAWMTLGTGEPFNAPPKDPNYTYKDVIILMSDGVNTQNRWYSNASEINDRQKKLCATPRPNPTTSPSMPSSVNTGGDGQQTVMKNCASQLRKILPRDPPTRP